MRLTRVTTLAFLMALTLVVPALGGGALAAPAKGTVTGTWAVAWRGANGFSGSGTMMLSQQATSITGKITYSTGTTYTGTGTINGLNIALHFGVNPEQFGLNFSGQVNPGYTAMKGNGTYCMEVCRLITWKARRTR